MKTSDVIKYYSNRDIRERILLLCKNREVAFRFMDGSYGKRPLAILFENEILDHVKNGATSFHSSEERWANPSLLSNDMAPKQVSDLRIGWDLVLDIDTKFFEYARICADLVAKTLKYHNVRNYSIKFSGGSGFHIGVNWESFPAEVNGVKSSALFPEIPMIIAKYIQELIKNSLSMEIIKFDGVDGIEKRTGVKIESEFDPYSVIKMDTIALSSRHLIRMPFVFNEKTWKISQPCKDPLKFEREMAEPENVDLTLGFLDKYREGEAKYLVTQAYDWLAENSPKEELHKDFKLPVKAIPEEYFPPCVTLIMNGLSDGRKRAVFILANFLRSCGWDMESAKKFILEINKKNKPPLKENYILSQLKTDKIFMPPNCDNPDYMLSLGVCKPDQLCSKIKNPATYTLKKSKFKKR